jgi:hypothetical protein
MATHDPSTDFDPFALGGYADPILLLAAERDRLGERALHFPSDSKEREAIWAQQDEIEDRMMATVATSAAGIMLQLDQLHDWVHNPCYEKLLESLIAGVGGLR